VKEFLSELGKWSRRFPKQPLTIVINSPGGCCISGLAMYDYIRMLSKKGHHVTTIGLGQVASMGSTLLQAGDKRLLGANASFLIHEPRGVSYGTMYQVLDDTEYTKMLWDHMVEILAERSKLSVKQIKEKAHRTDWWMMAKDAVKLGFADEFVCK
jgi:ATP-dependent Clp protease protease subunit